MRSLGITVRPLPLTSSSPFPFPSPSHPLYPLPTPLIAPTPGLPDAGFFGRNSKYGIPFNAIWICTLVSFIPGLLDLASPIAANAIFSLTAMALDLSYIIPIFLRRVFANHPDVMFKPGPFYMGDGLVGVAANGEWRVVFFEL